MRVYEAITLGRSRRHADGQACALWSSQYSPHASLPSHAHERSSISMVLNGEVEEEIRHGRESVGARAGACEVVFKPAGVPHRNRFGPRGARLLTIEMKGDLTDEPRWSNAPEACYGWMADARCTTLLTDLLERIGADGDSSIDEAAIVEVATELIALRLDALRLNECTCRRSLAAAYALLRERFAEPVRVQELAAAADVHPVYLARIFRDRFRTTICEYRQGLQVQRAAKLLAGGDDSPAAIALACGFADQSHLTRAFKRRIGLTPAAFRQVVRG